MSTRIEKGIARMAKLDVKEQELVRQANAIHQSSPLCQLPPVHGRVLDKAIAIQVKKAIIWNGLRDIILPGTKNTLWQVAIAQGLPTVRYGEEHHLNFSASDLKTAIKNFKGGFSIPSGMALQKSLNSSGGQVHFRSGGRGQKPRAAGVVARKRKLKKDYGLSPYGLMPEGVRRLNV